MKNCNKAVILLKFILLFDENADVSKNEFLSCNKYQVIKTPIPAYSAKKIKFKLPDNILCKENENPKIELFEYCRKNENAAKTGFAIMYEIDRKIKNQSRR